MRMSDLPTDAEVDVAQAKDILQRVWDVISRYDEKNLDRTIETYTQYVKSSRVLLAMGADPKWINKISNELSLLRLLRDLKGTMEVM